MYAHALLLPLSVAVSLTAAPYVPTPGPLGAPSPTEERWLWCDWNHDGRADVLTAAADGSARLLEQNAEGRFEERTVEAGLTGFVWTAARAADLDRDRRTDLVLLDAAGELHLFLRPDRGPFLPIACEALEGVAGFSDVETLDFDADGTTDLLLRSAHGTVLLAGSGDGRFREVALGHGAAPTPSARASAAGAGSPLSPPANLTGGTVGSTTPAGPGIGSTGVLVCAGSVVDAATSACLEASSTPTLGRLYPISTEWFVGGNGNVGLGTTSPGARLDVLGVARASQFVSTTPTGSPPFFVNSRTTVPLFSADLFDGLDSAAFRMVAALITTVDLANGAVNTAKLADRAVTTEKVADGAIDTDQLAVGAVNADALGDGSVSSTKLASNAVNATHLAPNAVTSGAIADGTVTVLDLAAASVSNAKLQDSAVTSLKILDGTIQSLDLAPGSVDSSALGDDAVRSSHIAPDAVTAAAIAAGSVGSSEVVDDSLTAADLAPGAVGTGELQANAVTSTRIAAGAVTTDRIAGGAVTTNELAVGAVSTNRIGLGAVTTDRVAAGAITTDRVAPGAITTDRIAPGAVDGTRISANAVDGARIVDGSIGAVELAPGAVTSGALAAGSVSAANLAPGAVTANALSAGAVTGPALAAGSVTGAALAMGSVNSLAIQNGTITSSDLADASINAAALAPGAVDSSAVQDGSLRDVDISNTAAISGTKVRPDFGTQLVTSDAGARFGAASGDRVQLATSGVPLRAIAANLAAEVQGRAVVVGGDAANEALRVVNPNGGTAARYELDDVSATSNAPALHVVAGGDGAARGLLIEMSGLANTGSALQVVHQGAGPGLDITSGALPLRVDRSINAGTIIEARNSLDIEFRVDSSGDAFVDGAFFGGGADYAEWVERLLPHEVIEPGDVVAVVGGKVTRAHGAADRFMVASTRPAVVGNHPDADVDVRDDATVVAFVGRAPVKVRGGCQVGDLLVPSGLGDGTAVALAPDAVDAAALGRVVGTAWAAAQGPGIVLVDTLVGVGAEQAAARAVARLERQLADRDALLERLAARITALESGR
jgi:hypothetical protein